MAALATDALAADQQRLDHGRHHVVVIEGMQFTPRTLEVRQGDTVEWVNRDLFAHTVVAENKLFQSGEITAGASWQWKAEKSGTIPYLCTLHPVMKATLVVK